ncbi:hypothetical protein DFA_03937 [Cavenderia fasciculata]|uniref:Uncharacterized protein n=1 Tax=Cavenderia fasciculata TaxID=261658 RepID=F4Q0U2_CACFS|nr:uncharacterized protein DFA_03937 [Cavenderia fasciculata]EGG18443.1 hypothetical protein DFA_03937 [Cavenderia fasciculata]|eukprot:XP_004366347.1 hypothetical protein DFA_03937 [Cavenderia fasciculata]
MSYYSLICVFCILIYSSPLVIVINSRVIFKTILVQMKKIQIMQPAVSYSASRPLYHRYSEFNDIGALLSTEESTNLLKYKFARGDTSKLTFEPTQRFYYILFHAELSLQLKIIDFLGEAIYDPNAFHYMSSFKMHHQVYIKFLDYFRDKKDKVTYMGSAILARNPVTPVEVYQSLLGPNKSLLSHFPFPDAFFMVATKELVEQVKWSEQATRLFERSRIEKMLEKFTFLADIGQNDYVTLVVESVTLVYNDNHSYRFVPFNLEQKRTEYGNQLGSTSLEKIDLLVLLDLCSLYGITQLPIQGLMRAVYTLDDIKLLCIVLDHPIVRSNRGPLIEYSSHTTGLETFKQMSTIPKLREKLFNYAANTLEKVKFMHIEMEYEFTASSLSTVCKWKNREMFYYVLENIADKSPAFLNTHVDNIYQVLQGRHTQPTAEERVGHIDLIEHLVEKRYLTLVPKYYACYPLVQSKRLRTLCLDHLSNLTGDEFYTKILPTIISQASTLGMIDTVQDIVETNWPALQITTNKSLARVCLNSLTGNSPNTHHLIIKMLDVVDITPVELLQVVSRGGGVKVILYLLDKHLGKEINELYTVDMLNKLINNGHLDGFIQVMKYLHEKKKEYDGLLHRLVNKIDIRDAFKAGHHNVIHYYMRLHYLYKDAGHRRRFYINVFKVKSLRRMISILVEANEFILIQDLIDKYDQRANITAIIQKPHPRSQRLNSQHPQRFLRYSKLIKLIH